MKFLKNLFSKTSKRGKMLRNIGLTIGSVGLGMEFDVVPLENILTDEKLIFWVIVIKYFFMGLGTILTLTGQAQTEDKPEEPNK